MKKYVMLYTFTALTIFALVAFSIYSRNSVVEVSAVKVNAITVENSVTCSGRVERIATTNVYSPVSGMIESVLVKSGDQVRAGQPIMTVQTAAAASSVPEDAGIPSGIPSEYQDLLSLYGGQLSSAQSQALPVTQTIAATTEGEITSIPAASQSYVTAGAPVAVIADNSGLQVRLSVNESQISDIKVGQKAVITGVGFKNSSYSGKVKKISSDAKQEVTTTGQETVVEVIVSVDNAGSDIKPGYTAKVKIVTSSNPDVLIAPYEAVRADKNGSEYVFRLKGNQAVKTPILTRQEFDSGFEVASGLSDNDLIIENPDSLSNGTRVIPSEKDQVSSDD